MNINLSLKYRIAVIIFILEAIMMSFVLWQTLGQSYQASSQQVFNNEQAILDLVGGISKTALITEEYAELQPYMEDLLTQTQITRLILSDANKTIVASTSSSDIGNTLTEFTNSPDHSWGIKEIKNTSGLMGIIAIEFSGKELIAAYTQARDFGISIAIFGMLIIAAVGLFVGFYLTRRLEKITITAQRLTEGDLTARTNIYDRDELGQLAAAFDNMVQRLVENEKELNQTLSDVQSSEQNLTITLNSIGDAVITTDAEGKVTRMNPVAETLTGWSLDDAQKKRLHTIFPIVDASTRKSIPNPVDKVLSTGETVYLSNHTTLIAKDGTEYQIADSAAPIRDTENNILGMVLVFNDVTEQYQLREAATKSKRDLQAILDNSPSIIYVKDHDGRFVFANTQFVNLLHKSREELIGKTPYELFPKDIADQHLLNDKAVLKAGNALEFEEHTLHDDGAHTYSSIKFPLFNDSGEIYAICGISNDITDRIQKEEQLRRSQKMNALGKLTGGIAHDYNNMLGVILGYAELLEANLTDHPKLTGYLKEIHHAGERGAKLTQKLLSFLGKISLMQNI